MYENLTAGKVKAAMKNVGASSSDLWNVPVADIKVLDGFNVRVRNAEYIARVEWLRNSIMENGFMKDKPLSGYVAEEDGVEVIYVIDGHTRLEAVKNAIALGVDIKTLPVVTKPAGTSLEDLVASLEIANSGQPLAPIEKAAVCKRMIGYGVDEATIAKRLGFTKQYVSDLLSLLAAPKVIRNMVETGKVSAANASATLKKHGSKAAAVLEEAVASAKANGKDKVTKETLKAPRRDLVVEGVKWIKGDGERVPSEDALLIEFLAFLTNERPEYIRKKVGA